MPANLDRNGLPEALHTARPHPSMADQLRLFGQFVGSWQLECTFDNPGGPDVIYPGELRFGWVLGGRAIQDVWIVPSRDHPDEGKAPGFHGTTLRFYDSTISAWRSTWIDPCKNLVRRFLGQPVGPDIELISDEEQPRLRWRFTDITPDSFAWIGERATDEQPSWTRQLRMQATRIDTVSSAALPNHCLDPTPEQALDRHRRD
ncbi:MAG: hypothetical protein J2P17_03015 [Mycobacterium sp.]|nr:hypothetical protein [Mycobacterium sp.]